MRDSGILVVAHLPLIVPGLKNSARGRAEHGALYVFKTF